MKEYWKKFCHWRGWKACADGWRAFIRWHGWGDFVRWQGWKTFGSLKCWHLHPLLTLLLCVVGGGGVIWVFVSGNEEHPVAFGIYALAAYALTVAVIGIPRLIRWIREDVLTNRFVRPLVEDEQKRFLLDLFREQIMNFGYGVFKTVSGLWMGIPWVWADGLYNLVQGILQMAQITLHRKHLPVRQQWKSYRIAGWVILVVHLTVTGLVFMMIHQGQAEEYPGFMIFATAAFTFYKLITAMIDVAKDRKHASPVDSSVYLLDLTQAMFSIFSLQVAMLHVFDDGSIDAKLMNSMTGGVVCLLIMLTGLYMIRRAGRELKKCEE